MPIEVPMAKLSPTMESGVLVSWQVKVGDQVKEGDTLAEIQTDKATMPLEAFDDGIVALLDVEEGAELALGQRLLVLAEKGEDPEAIAQQMAGSASASGSSSTATPAAEPAKAVPAPAAAVVATATSGTNGTQGNGAAIATPVATPTGRVKSTPLARKIAAANDLDIRLVPGSGPRGRVIRRDVENYLARQETVAAAPAATAVVPSGQVERIPMSRMRQIIAHRMTLAKNEAPDIHLTVDVEVDQILEIRARLNERLAKQNVKLSVSDFVTKAVATALIRHPEMNATFEGDTIVRHPHAHVGIAVALDDGLIVPVLKNADTLGLRGIREGTKQVVEAARSNRITPEMLDGGTFTISNLGMYGIKQFDAILNLPQVGILAVGTAEQRPVVRNGQLALATLMTITLTADHRVIDGAVAAQFVQTLQGLLEEPAAMLL